jgi:hypothetical protein
VRRRSVACGFVPLGVSVWSADRCATVGARELLLWSMVASDPGSPAARELAVSLQGASLSGVRGPPGTAVVSEAARVRIERSDAPSGAEGTGRRPARKSVDTRDRGDVRRMVELADRGAHARVVEGSHSEVSEKIKNSQIFLRAEKGLLASFSGLLLFASINFAQAVGWNWIKLFIFLVSFFALYKKVNILYVILIGAAVSFIVFGVYPTL